MNSVLQFIQGLVDPVQAQALAYLCGANLLLGALAALVKGQFELVRLADFWKRVAVVFGSYLAVSIASRAMADFAPLQTALWVALLAYLAAQVTGNLKDLGLPIPDRISNFLER